MSATEDQQAGADEAAKGSSPAARGGAGAYIEGELGALYLLSMLIGAEPRGLAYATLDRIRFQGVDAGFALDDLVLHGTRPSGAALLEIQSKRDVKFSPKDPVFEAICAQIAKVQAIDGVAAADHLLAVATQRTSHRISGSYQDVLEWARRDDASAPFFERLAAPGVANPDMRSFVETFRTHLVAQGIADNDETIWRLLRRFQILEFDFESSSPLAKTYALHMAQSALAPAEGARATALWSTLIDIALETAKTGGSLDRASLRKTLIDRGFGLAGDKSFVAARAKLADMAKHALADIGTSIGGTHLPRHAAIAVIDAARDTNRYVEIRGGPGVGKSALLAQLAQRLRHEAPIIVLDPIGTPGGGWIVLAQALGVEGTAAAFLTDLALAGGATIFIDSLDMFADAERRRTVNDILRDAAAIPGLSVVATARSEFGQDSESWVADDAIARFGGPRQIEVKDLDEDEVAILRERAPSLRALLQPGHPAAAIARNLYRLSRLIRITDSETIRTEVDLAEHWWATGDGAPDEHRRSAQRILSDVADAALAGRDGITLREDSAARSHLLRSLTLREAKRDQLVVYHDVLRDWAVGLRLHEDPSLIDALDLARATPLAIARGVEFAARLALERSDDADDWLALMRRLSGPSAHSSWRRHALLALLRSERAPELLERCSALILREGGALLTELTNATAVAETLPTADIFKAINHPGADAAAKLPSSLRTSVTPSARRLLSWVVRHEAALWTQMIPAVLKLVEIQMPMNVIAPGLAEPAITMLFRMLLQADIRDRPSHLRADPAGAPLYGSSYRRMVEDLRSFALLNCAADPAGTRAYLAALTAERDDDKVKAVRPLSQVIAPVAPRELADLIEATLIGPLERRSRSQHLHDRILTHGDTDYLPPSPAQRPFLDLLDADPAIGLALIRRLTAHVVEYYAGGKPPGDDGFMLMFDDGPRFFPWIDTYLWTRGQAREYAVASGLMALEAWSHKRLDDGAPVDAVIEDVLGPPGSCAAYVMIAVDLLLSHWSRTRTALIPFMACPALLAAERRRQSIDQLGLHRTGIGDEPQGPVRIEHLHERASRSVSLEQALPHYLRDDAAGAALRARLGDAVAALPPYGHNDDFADAAFMGRYAANMLDRANWKDVEDGLAYQSPPEEARHIAQLQVSREALTRSSDIAARISLAISDRARASTELARDAAEYADNGVDPHIGEVAEDMAATRLVATALLIARDGDDALLDAKEGWVREVVTRALAETADRFRANQLNYNRPALATCALGHLWNRRRQMADRNALVAIGAREDRCGATAFEATMAELISADPRLVKAAMRVAFGTNRWRRADWDEPAEIKERTAHEKSEADQHAIAAEIAWLDGGPEPGWPDLPDEAPIVRRSHHVRLPSIEDDEIDQDAASKISPHRRSEERVDSHALAQWLKMAIDAPPPFEWLAPLVERYAQWTAVMNGHALPSDTEIDRAPTEWNDQYYTLAARVMMQGNEVDLQRQIALVVALPDRSFGDAAETLLHAADVWYFNNSSAPSPRAVTLRTRCRDRAMTMRRWGSNLRPGDLSIDWDTGGIVARLCFNTHVGLVPARTYLVPAVFDRIDPLLDVLTPMMTAGPTPFIAQCTMNMLLVAPRARHATFLMGAAEAWLDRLQGDATIWTELGLGRRVVTWLDAAATEDASLLAASHPLRIRMDIILGRLIAFGVAEAHEFELRIQRAHSKAVTRH